MLGFEEKENRSTRGKTSRCREENKQTQPTYEAESNPGHIDGRQVLSPLRPLPPPPPPPLQPFLPLSPPASPTCVIACHGQHWKASCTHGCCAPQQDKSLRVFWPLKAVLHWAVFHTTCLAMVLKMKLISVSTASCSCSYVSSTDGSFSSSFIWTLSRRSTVHSELK